jgi:hypothetical protein
VHLLKDCFRETQTAGKGRSATFDDRSARGHDRTAPPAAGGQERPYGGVAHPSSFSADIAEALVAAGLGKKNIRGTFDVNAAGRAYIAEMNLSTKSEKRERSYVRR